MSTALTPFTHETSHLRWERETTVTAILPPNRFHLWIDMVGGYLVCTNPRIRIGQMVPNNQVDVPLVADIARHHATIRRDAESYLIEPVHQVRLNGVEIDRPTLLRDGAAVELNRGVQLKFSQPHALSLSARLDIVSRHRTQPTTSGILLMADTCVLGPAENCHVVCRQWKREVVLHRLPDSLYCLVDGTFTVDGVAYQRRAMLRPGAQVVGDDFTFSLESA